MLITGIQLMGRRNLVIHDKTERLNDASKSLDEIIQISSSEPLK